MYYWTDLHLEHDDKDDRIVEAVAAAFEIATESVTVGRIDDAVQDAWNAPGLQVLVQRDDPVPGRLEFPVTLMVTLRHGTGVGDPVSKVRAIARNLGIGLITDVETQGDTWRLVMPDGKDKLVQLDPSSDEGTLSLTRQDRQELDRHRVAVA
ncbi:MAG TPA: hypothetical protein VD767_11015 [Thermomicrobiales bacterium]|nr:hypothetical protein [Thermomicrobiales bacterium]